MERIAARWARRTGIPIEDFRQEIELWLLEHPVKDAAHLKVAAHRACLRMARKGFGAGDTHSWRPGDESELDLRRRAEQDWSDLYLVHSDSPEAIVAAYELWKLLAMRTASYRGPTYQAAALDIILGEHNFSASRQVRDHVRYDFRHFLAAIVKDETPKSHYSR